MATIYFPSCKFTAQYPLQSEKIKDYMKDRHGAKIARCCKPGLASITGEDTVVYICNTCAAFFRESTPANKVVSVWELLVEDKDFRFPKYENRKVTIQDCWRTNDNIAQQKAARGLLEKMNIEIVELNENCDTTKFCGYTLYEPLPARYDELAPNGLWRMQVDCLQSEHSRKKKR